MVLDVFAYTVTAHWKLVPGPSSDTTICKCPSPLYKMVRYWQITVYILPDTFGHL